METTDIKLETPLAAEIPENEMGHSLMALIQTHAEPSDSTVNQVNQLDQLASGLEATVVQRAEQRQNSKSHSLRMAEMYLAIGQMLELLHNRIAENPPSTGSAGDIHELIQASEERQCSTIEAALKQWESERKSQEAERMIHMETLQVQAQIEVNRLLRVMWLGTGLAATGAGTALFLMRN
ncbi:MAG: hypothetical protein NTW74_03735 [Acidobacteria bacterium]|nr:hypothetical protein [Acidobacteriota bacterium]